MHRLVENPPYGFGQICYVHGRNNVLTAENLHIRIEYLFSSDHSQGVQPNLLCKRLFSFATDKMAETKRKQKRGQ